MRNIALLDLGLFNSMFLQDVQYSWHNHGLGMIGTCMCKAGIPFKYIGLKYMQDWDSFADAVKNFDLIGISVMSSDYPVARQAIDIIKDVNPKCIICVGGIHATVGLADLEANPKIDHIFVGEGEISFIRFLKRRSYKKVIRCFAPKNLDDLPFLHRSLYPSPLERSVALWSSNGRVATFITARGCPYNCSFCQPAERNHFGTRLRRRSPGNVVAEIAQVCRMYDPGYIVFYDDTFMIDVEWLEEFAKYYSLIERPFLASARADFICKHPEIITLLKDKGCFIVSVGFESGSGRILDMVSKGTTPEQNYKAVDILNKAGIRIFANIMYGFPTETRQEQYQTYMLCKYIKKNPGNMVSPAYFTPFPGSYLGDYCRDTNISLIGKDQYVRFGRDKIKGVDYDWLDSFIWNM